MPDAVLDVHDGADEAAVWVCSFPTGERGGWGRHHHRQHQLAWVSSGVATVLVDDEAWVVTPDRAVWVPGGRAHDVVNREGARLHCLYVWPEHCPLDWPDPVELAIGALARELLLALGATGADTPVSHAVATVLFAQLAAGGPVPGPSLPMPRDDRAAEVAAALLDGPACQDTVEQWADRLATSASTLRRAFLTDTGLTFSEWRTRARLAAALPLLADGVGVGRVARRVGYASRSGFVDAFRRHFGHPPATYRAQHAPAPVDRRAVEVER